MLLQGLPVEILGRIFHAVVKQRSRFGPGRLDALKNLRLTCKRFAAIGTASLFHTATLYPEKDGFQPPDLVGPDESDEEDLTTESDPPATSRAKFCRLQNNVELRDKIRTVVLNTSIDGEEESKKPDTLSAWLDAASGISRFPNLSSVHVRFRRACSDETKSYNYATETIDFRTEILETVFAALNNEEYPTPNLRSLSINNLQDIGIPHVTQSPDFKAVLSRLTELHLKIATENEDACPENNISYNTLHSFFQEVLPNAWLKPAANQLTHLTLYCTTYWGWAPAFDPRTLHFPKLKYLALGNYTFAHDWQIDWITTHGSTLKTLVLDDCPILFYIWPAQSLREHTFSVSHEDHIKFIDNDELDDRGIDDSHYTYSTRWHNLFPRLETGLPALTKFVYTHGEWPDAFDTRDEVLSCLYRNRYIVFNGGIGPSQWEELREPQLKKYLAFNDGNRNPEFEKLLRTHEETYMSFSSGGFDDLEVKTPAAREPPFRLVTKKDGPLDTDAGKGGCQREDEESFYALLGTVARRCGVRG